MHRGTKWVHVGEDPNFELGGDVVVPIHLATTFARRKVREPTRGWEYTRTGNPTRRALEQKLAVMENARYGLAFSSGMAAETTLLLTVLKEGDHVVAGDVLYGGTRRVLENTMRRFGVETSYVDTSKPGAVKKAIRKETKVVWLESPTNPLMALSDIEKISKASRESGAITVVDNTFASPYIQNPLDLGADVVVHSTTKYIGGHSDVLGGALMLSDGKIADGLKFNQNAIGAVPSPFDCFLILRGTKTLAVRMEKHSQNATEVAEFLESHESVVRVHYPGSEDHPQRALFKKQMRLPGGMVSFELRGGAKAAETFLGRLRVFALAESLGGVESLADHPATMTHASVPADVRRRAGVSDGLVRLSVGIEDARDLLADLGTALG